MTEAKTMPGKRGSRGGKHLIDEDEVDERRRREADLEAATLPAGGASAAQAFVGASLAAKTKTLKPRNR